MPDIVIGSEGLGKSYRLRHRSQNRYVSLRDVLAEGVRRLGRRLLGSESEPPDDDEEFWALRDVSFEARRGDVIGIIGRNGAGKSTLLKILSRITEPTEGRVRIRGRVASLLEVGTGFHPELSGRENIHLNGAILGMSRAETKRKFDEIVAFADVERFLDTPVKHYSSGMYVRLAFAVAAHLEPEILVVDEVLAVGDAEFQKRCLGKMRDVSRGGRTVLFVSHNMAAVRSLCGRGILLEHGQVIVDGTSNEAVARYLDSDQATDTASSRRALSRSLTLIGVNCSPSPVHQHSPFTVWVTLLAAADEVISDIALLIHAPGGERVALIDLRSAKGPYRLSEGAQLDFRAELSDAPFVENRLSLGLYINSDSMCNSFMDLLEIAVIPADSKPGVLPREAQFRGLVELRATVRGEISRAASNSPVSDAAVRP
jgi:lipopolysaccharide transport system ATP-binding protein